MEHKTLLQKYIQMLDETEDAIFIKKIFTIVYKYLRRKGGI